MENIDYSFCSDEQLIDLLKQNQQAKDRTWTAYREDRIDDDIYDRRKIKQSKIQKTINEEISKRKNYENSSSVSIQS